MKLLMRGLWNSDPQSFCVAKSGSELNKCKWVNEKHKLWKVINE